MTAPVNLVETDEPHITVFVPRALLANGERVTVSVQIVREAPKTEEPARRYIGAQNING